MGEYFDWVNVDKKEYLCPNDFDLGNKLHESAFAGNDLLGALYDRLSSEWKGDMIIFLGDEIEISKDENNPALRKIIGKCGTKEETICAAEYVWEEYKDISGEYKASESVVRNEIEWIVKENEYDDFRNYYRVSRENPYAGLFKRDGKDFRYTINRSKKEYFDLTRTRLTYKNEEGVLTTRINPLPLLCAYGASTYDRCTGLWLGDEIEVSDEMPGDGYKDMSDEYRWDC